MPTSTDPDPLHLSGVTLADRYLVEGMVAEGGFSFVYRAQHQVWRKPCVLKFLKGAEELSDTEREKVVAALVQEGILLRELSSRAAAILQAHDMGTWESPAGYSYPYLVLEWLDGVTLRQAIRQGRKQGVKPLTIGEVITLFTPVAQALTATHRRGVAHRDLKPENLYLCGELRHPDTFLKVLDFGVAKVLSEQVPRPAGEKAQRSQTAFTPWYGAPEQFMADYGSTGPWTDVFALALIMVETMSFQRALSGDDVHVLFGSAVNPEQRPTPRNKGLPVSDPVEAVFSRALCVEIEGRYQSMGEFWNELLLALDMPSLDMPHSSQRLSQSHVQRFSSVPPPPAVPRDAVSAASSPAVSNHPSFAYAPTASSASAEAPIPGLGVPAALPGQPVAAPPSGSKLLVIGALVAAAALGGVVMWKRQAPPAPSDLVASAAPSAPAAMARPSASAAPVAACPTGMVRIPGGEFYMGYEGKDAFPFEQPVHSVKLDPFCVDVTEVTVEAYRACSDSGKCMRAGTTVAWPDVSKAQQKAYGPLCNIDDPGRDRHPINCVDWDMARNYCERNDKRLPTSAEWEFAVRGPDGRTYPWGDEPPDANRLNACGKECLDWAKRNGLSAEMSAMHTEDDGFPTTAPVGSFPKGRSRYGLDDVIGNVMEWVQDWNGTYAKAAATNPQGPPTGTERVIRGGAWNAGQMFWVRPSFRFQLAPESRSHGVGFRCASAARTLAQNSSAPCTPSTPTSSVLLTVVGVNFATSPALTW